MEGVVAPGGLSGFALGITAFILPLIELLPSNRAERARVAVQVTGGAYIFSSAFESGRTDFLFVDSWHSLSFSLNSVCHIN